MDTTMPTPTSFWDKIADKYAKKPVPDPAAYEKKLEITRGYLRPDMEILEFGCGTGSTAVTHAPYVQHIHATDISARMLEIGNQRAEAAGVGNVTFEQVTIEDLKIPDSTYDAVLGLSILHLLTDYEAALAKVHHMLKPGGIFVSSTTCVGDMRNPIKYLLPFGYALGLIPYVKTFTADKLVDSLSRAGFTIEYHWQPSRGKAVFIVARKG